jgi:hypothetical protein
VGDRRLPLCAPYRRGETQTRLDKALASLAVRLAAAPDAATAFLARLRAAIEAAEGTAPTS